MRCIVLALGLSACSASTPPREPDYRISSSLDSAIKDAVQSGVVDPARSRRMMTPKNMQVRHIGEVERPLPPLGRRTRVNVRFQSADLGDALRFLADAGQFALVAEGKLSGKVTADMTRVVPYDALIALAEAHGANVERHGRIVVVTPRATH